LLSEKVKIRIYKTINLPVVVYGCESLSLILREEHRLMVFENIVLRRIFGLKRDKVAGGCRILHEEELRNLYSLPSMIRTVKSRRIRQEGHVARLGEKKNVYRILVGKPEGKRPLGIPICRWVDYIKMDLRETEWGGMDWIDLAEDREQCRALVKMAMNPWIP
jgi:hypothetical protein